MVAIETTQSEVAPNMVEIETPQSEVAPNMIAIETPQSEVAANMVAIENTQSEVPPNMVAIEIAQSEVAPNMVAMQTAQLEVVANMVAMETAQSEVVATESPSDETLVAKLQSDVQQTLAQMMNCTYFIHDTNLLLESLTSLQTLLLAFGAHAEQSYLQHQFPQSHGGQNSAIIDGGVRRRRTAVRANRRVNKQ